MIVAEPLKLLYSAGYFLKKSDRICTGCPSCSRFSDGNSQLLQYLMYLMLIVQYNASYLYTGLWGSINAATPIAGWFMNQTQKNKCIWDFRNLQILHVPSTTLRVFRDRSSVVQPEPRARACCLLQVYLMQRGVGVASRVALMGLE